MLSSYGNNLYMYICIMSVYGIQQMALYRVTNRNEMTFISFTQLSSRGLKGLRKWLSGSSAVLGFKLTTGRLMYIYINEYDLQLGLPK